MKRIGIYCPARGLGSTLIAAHLHYYLREHGVRCCASSHGFRGERPLGLARWQDIPENPIEPVCFQTLPRTPLGEGVDVVDVHAEMYAAELGELACLEWVIPIRDTDAADPELRQHLPFGRIRVAESALPESNLLRQADETTTPIWRLAEGANSSAGQATCCRGWSGCRPTR